MTDYRKVLVAFDGSPSSRNALKQAFTLGKWIKVLAVVPDYAGEVDLTGVVNINDTIHGLGQKLLAEAKKIAQEEKAHILTNLEQGEPYERIVHVADDEKCDLIIMGRKGLTKLEQKFMGGVTAKVIGYTTKDVMVVPRKGDVNFKDILLATDGSKNTREAVKRALEFSKYYKSKLTLVSVVYTNNEFWAQAPQIIDKMIHKAHVLLEDIRTQAENDGIDTHVVVREGDPHVAIAELASKLGSGLIIMGAHGRKGLTRLLMGSVVEQVIGFSTCPVMVCHSTG
jgi:nucleotide-binding universal stress UspA family protein